MASNENHREEIAHLLARALHRLLTRQNVPTSGQDCLASSATTLLSVTKPVNTTGNYGDTR